MTGNQLLLLLSSVAFSYSALAQQKSYTQQEVNTKIAVTLDDEKHLLRGHIDLDYTNNSKDTLSFIYFHIYPNAYKNNHTAYAKQMAMNGATSFMKLQPEDRGGIDSLSFTINGESTTIQQTEHIDVIKVLLPTPLLPNQTIAIASPFKVKVPIMTSRLGHQGQSYQITQWFPKPAVYDKNGWNPFPYLNYGEFYSEFGTYDVTINVPKNYIVMATGNLQNTEEQQWLDSLAQLPMASFKSKKVEIPSAAGRKTLRFTEKNIHDFAWFADKNWMVRQEKFTIPENGQEVLSTACFYVDDTTGNKESLKFLKKAILGYSKFVGAYPYKTVKSVTGPLSAGGGMEYPTITIIDAFKSEVMVEQVIVHEVGHNWFYGVLGNNERVYPFMDESINSYYEQRVIKDSVGNSLKGSAKDLMTDMEKVMVYHISTSNDAKPICYHSAHYPEVNYGVDIYQKGAQYFSYLAEYMGRDSFDAAMQYYFQKWQFKHPQPEDFYLTLQSKTSKPIGWFFEDAILSNQIADVKVGARKSEGEHIALQHNQPYELPAALDFFDKNDSLLTTVWVPPFVKKSSVEVPNGLSYDYALLNTAVPDVNSSNNATKKTLKLKPFVGYSIKPSYNLYFSPAIGYNMYDKLMIGGLIHNMTFPAKRLEYAFAPMYGVGSNSFVYTGFVNYFISGNNGVVKDINLTLNSKKFSNNQSLIYDDLFFKYIKNKLSAEFNFVTNENEFHLKHQLTASIYHIFNSTNKYLINDSHQVIGYTQPVYLPSVYGRLNYIYANERKFFPSSVMANVVIGKNVTQLMLEGRYKLNYRASKNGVSLRGFAGLNLNYGITGSPRHTHLNIVGSGWNDYLYDHTFVGRNATQGFWSNQSTLSMGGFYTHNKLHLAQAGVSDNLLLALNVDIAIPKTPLSLFGNIAFNNIKSVMTIVDPIQYEAGIALHVMNRFTLALPILLSPELNDYRNYILGKNKMLKSIAFRMDLNDLVPSRKFTKLLF